MYVVKVYKLDDNQINLLGVRFYNKFENAVADVCTVDANLSDILNNEDIKTLGRPSIYCSSVDDDGVSDDFEFRYENKITIYIGKIITEDQNKEEAER